VRVLLWARRQTAPPRVEAVGRVGDEDDHRDDGSLDAEHREPTASSPGPIGREQPARHGVRGRGGTGRSGGRFKTRERYRRHRGQLRVEELIGHLLRIHGLTDLVREQCIYIYWREMITERIAERTCPDALSSGVLKVWASNSTWMHELQFYKAQMIEQINGWIDAHRVWLGPPPLVTDLRFTLGTPREPIVDPDQLRRLRAGHRRRLRPPAALPQLSSADRQAICAEASVIEDTELRSMVERVRMKWNR
jgi:hypothetical protein